MKITYYGHSCFSVLVNGKTLLFDPFITGNPQANHISLESIAADYILISHAHQDHILDVEAIAKRTGAKLISNFEIIEWYEAKGFTNAHGLNQGGQAHFDFGTVKFVTAVHSSSFPDGTYAGNPGGFVVTPKGQNNAFYYAGDTALTMDMRLIGDAFTIDFALLPIGDNYTMGIEDAVRCAEFVGTDHIVGIHYNTFPPIQIDPQEAVKCFSRTGKTLHLPKIGETIEL